MQQPERPPRSDGTVVAFAVAAIVLVMIGVGVASYYAGRDNRSTTGAAVSSASAPVSAPAAVSSQVAVGAHAFVQFACAQCHGDRGAGGVSPYVPALQSLAPGLTVAQLTSTIEHGAGVSSNPTRPFMPIWHGVIAKQQIAALVAYMKAGFPAVQYADPVPVPGDQGDIAAGQALYQRYSCINCHGPNGLGGVPNPLSEDKTIPPLTGADFRSEFNTDQKITDVIRSGSVIGRAPIVSMPHWGGILSDADLQALVTYIKTFK
jgi:cbb3-type cytochrome c oxidase subunit III